MNSQIILYLVLSIISFDFILEFILSYLNLYYQKDVLPDELKDIYDTDKFQKSQEYLKVNTRFSFLTSTFSYLLMVIVLLNGWFGWLDIFVKLTYSNPIVQSLMFFGILFMVSDFINLPFSIYKTFVIEERFGFNKTTPKIYILDKLKGYIMALVVGGILLTAFLWLIETMGQNFWIYFWVVISVFILLINLFYTSVILPMFNKLTPLGDGGLRRAIENYSRKVNFPLTNIFIMDGSKRSAKSNAFFSGIGKKKKIVLFDTLISNHSEEELVAVLAHEAGHYKKHHIIQSLAVSIVQMGLILFILSLFIFNKELSYALGGGESSIHLNLIAFVMLFSPISHITGVLANIWSRKNEYEADRYAAETYSAKALSDALKKLSADNLSNLTPHPALVFVHYSHPPLLQRLKALNK
ncbi:MAG TPA: M48 family metallopeptidase [Cytophagaceae bacterium]|jgi:STE24 endopeptidase|nr:M48 family metallopeptidase [Cytophagaceae bacterium]